MNIVWIKHFNHNNWCLLKMVNATSKVLLNCHQDTAKISKLMVMSPSQCLCSSVGIIDHIRKIRFNIVYYSSLIQCFYWSTCGPYSRSNFFTLVIITYTCMYTTSFYFTNPYFLIPFKIQLVWMLNTYIQLTYRTINLETCTPTTYMWKWHPCSTVLQHHKHISIINS